LIAVAGLPDSVADGLYFTIRQFARRGIHFKNQLFVLTLKRGSYLFNWGS